jgi:hypothetical protein
VGGENIVTTAEQKHPADELGRALARANGILTLISDCYDKSEATFETGNAFVHESIIAVEAMLNGASAALAKLYQDCDLSIVREAATEANLEQPVAEVPTVQVPVFIQPEIPPQQHVEAQSPVSSYVPASNYAQQNYGNSYLGFFGPAEPVSNLADKLDNILVNMPARPRAKHAEIFDKPAENYDELLQKLTALADVAAYQAHQNSADAGLGSALEELRADLIKLRSVA